MAGCLITSLILIYASGTFVLLVFGIFSATGNPAILIEHYIKKEDNTLEDNETKNVKSRVMLQYFFACALSLVFATALLIYSIKKNKKQANDNKNTEDNSSSDFKEILNEEDNNNSSDPIELSAGIKKSIKSIGTLGMGEKDID